MKRERNNSGPSVGAKSSAKVRSSERCCESLRVYQNLHEMVAKLKIVRLEFCKRRRQLRSLIPYQARLFKCWFWRDKFLRLYDFFVAFCCCCCIESVSRLGSHSRRTHGAAELCNSPHARISTQKYVNLINWSAEDGLSHSRSLRQSLFQFFLTNIFC